MSVWVEVDLCDGCSRCVKACPYGALEVKEGRAKVLQRCTSCGACLDLCKKKAILTDAESMEIPDFSDYQGIWVFAEQRDGQLNRVSLELLGKAYQLGNELNQEVYAVLIGHHVSDLADTLIRHGADYVYLAENRLLKDYRTLSYTKVIEELIRKHKPNIFLLGASHIGRDLAPRVSRRIGAGLTADCIDLSIDSKERILLQTRPAFGGNVMATIASRYSRPQMATVRPGVMEAMSLPDHKGLIVKKSISLAEKEIGLKILNIVNEEKKEVNLSAAKVIVAGGRGVGDENGFRALRELAEVMGGEVAGTRVAVESGWIPAENQVGQTGKSVRPEIYIACGISGAIQHRAGMMHSRYIVAVNKDPAA
ncbi:MAG: FAD-binding protein, partial [Desulfobacterales bacterium]